MKNKYTFFMTAIACAVLFIVVFSQRSTAQNPATAKKMEVVSSAKEMTDMTNSENLHELYLAGGCFWGVEGFIKRLPGVHETDVGYANGTTATPTYKEVCTGSTGHAETVRVLYDDQVLTTEKLLEAFFLVVDPTSKNRQGNDRGTQYRSGIYYVSEKDLPIIEKAIADQQKNHTEAIVTEIKPMENYFSAEEYHQNYLDKNPEGYCHINLGVADEFAEQEGLNQGLSKLEKQKYTAPSKDDIKKRLTDIQFRVTQNADTERPFTNEYNDNFERGIYVDIVTGEPLFTSFDKFNSSCGWPSFSKPIVPEVVKENQDDTLNMSRTEVRSQSGDTHLGHVFTDGPKDKGGLRYCINSASLKFVSYDDMGKEGYGYLKDIFADTDK